MLTYHLVFRFDLKTLPVDFVECLMRFLPTENEVKVLRLYERERKPLENLSDEDRFMMQFSKIERLMQKMTIMAFIGNFAESIQMLTPVSDQLWRGRGQKIKKLRVAFSVMGLKIVSKNFLGFIIILAIFFTLCLQNQLKTSQFSYSHAILPRKCCFLKKKKKCRFLCPKSSGFLKILR